MALPALILDFFFVLAVFFLFGFFIVIAETKLACKESERWKSCCAPVRFL